MNPILVAAAIPVFLAMMGLELWLGRRRGLRLYRLGDSAANLGNGMGQQVIGAFSVPITIGIYAVTWERFRLHTFSPRSALAWVLLLFGVDLAYWVFHWASHRVNFLWAGHIVHHQSEEYNLSVALRQSWFGQLMAWPFYLPLAVAGFPPAMFVAMTTLNTLYQFWIHTRAVKRLGWLEWVLNTPSHHRVHHGINPEYIDRNYGGIFIFWDRLFGTFEPEQAEPAYGLVKPLDSFGPLWANLQYWVEMARMARHARRFRDKLWAFLAPPEWKPPELGGAQSAPPVDARTRLLYDPPIRRRTRRLVLVQVGLMVGATAWFILHPSVWLAAAILAGVSAWGWQLRGERQSAIQTPFKSSVEEMGLVPPWR